MTMDFAVLKAGFLVGSVGGPLVICMQEEIIVCVLPVIFYYEAYQSMTEKRTRINFNWLILIVGCIIGGLGTWESLEEMIHSP